VQAGDRERCLSGVVCVRGDAMQQERSTGDRLEMFVWLGQPHEQRPPVVDEGDHPCHEPAARQILGGEAAPAPLAFQLVEVVLGIGPIAIELGECEDLVWGRGDQHGVLVPRGRHVALNPDSAVAMRYGEAPAL